MFARLVIVKCKTGQEQTFVERARGALRFYLERPGCRGAHLLQSRNDPSQLLALSIWNREVDLLAAREQPQYQDTMAGLAETYAEPQSVGEWDVVEL